MCRRNHVLGGFDLTDGPHLLQNGEDVNTDVLSRRIWTTSGQIPFSMFPLERIESMLTSSAAAMRSSVSPFLEGLLAAMKCCAIGGIW